VRELPPAIGRKLDRARVAGVAAGVGYQVRRAYGPEMTREALRVTTTVPIITFIRAPVESGLVASLARPGNITGLTNDTGPDLQGKRLELLREGVPKLRRVAYLGPKAEWEGPGGINIRAAARACAGRSCRARILSCCSAGRLVQNNGRARPTTSAASLAAVFLEVLGRLSEEIGAQRRRDPELANALRLLNQLGEGQEPVTEVTRWAGVVSALLPVPGRSRRRAGTRPWALAGRLLG
jgi:hypothetical protein